MDFSNVKNLIYFSDGSMKIISVIFLWKIIIYIEGVFFMKGFWIFIYC